MIMKVRNTIDSQSIGNRIAEVAKLRREDLVSLWEQLIGQAPPKSISTALVRRAVVYGIQEKAYGGLKRYELKALSRSAELKSDSPKASSPAPADAPKCTGPSSKMTGSTDADFCGGNTAGKNSTEDSNSKAGTTDRERAKTAATSSSPSTNRQRTKLLLRSGLKPGTRLIRNWQDKAHVVDVYQEGFGWNGKIYKSLTSIAEEITGNHRSGPRFFRT